MYERSTSVSLHRHSHGVSRRGKRGASSWSSFWEASPPAAVSCGTSWRGSWASCCCLRSPCSRHMLLRYDACLSGDIVFSLPLIILIQFECFSLRRWNLFLSDAGQCYLMKGVVISEYLEQINIGEFTKISVVEGCAYTWV